ncbi:DNA polymerase IV, partial [Microbacterium sp. SUBG005]
MESRGIRFISDILDTPRHALDQVLGAADGGAYLASVAGIDAREVHTGRAEKSVGHEETFHTDISDTRTLHVELRRLADRVGARLRTQQYEAATISIKVRFSDFTTLSRSRTLPEPTSVGQRIGDAAIELFDSI